jgi:phage FluMu gp28-like protein
MSGDSTGIGTGLVEFAQEQPGVGQHRVEAVHFAGREKRQIEGIEKEDTALVTELMALDLLKTFEDHRIKIPAEMELRDDLRKPQRLVSKSGVRIAATDDKAGHADAFWSLALLVRAMKSRGGTFAFSGAEELLSGGPVGWKYDNRTLELS